MFVFIFRLGSYNYELSALGCSIVGVIRFQEYTLNSANDIFSAEESEEGGVKMTYLPRIGVAQS
jgi:hypothetical protein